MYIQKVIDKNGVSLVDLHETNEGLTTSMQVTFWMAPWQRLTL